MYIRTYIYVYIYMYIYSIHTYIHIHIYIHIYIYIVHIHIYIHTFIKKSLTPIINRSQDTMLNNIFKDPGGKYQGTLKLINLCYFDNKCLQGPKIHF